MKAKLKMKFLIAFLISLYLISCQKKDLEIINLHFQKDLIPEGIAIDPANLTIFLNSLHRDKIVTSNIDGTNPKDFIQSNQYGYLSGFGMLIKGDTLFALGNSLSKITSKSVLLLLNKNTGSFIKSYSPTDTTFKYLNDLAVCKNGDIYITDSETNRIYTIEHSEDSLKVYIESDEIKYSNGIAVSDDNKHLYLASYEKGIRVVDLATKQIINNSNPEYTGIDGMKFYRNSLIAMLNAKAKHEERGVYRFILNQEEDSIIKKEKIISFSDSTHIPTTFAIVDGYIYFNMNSQIDKLEVRNNSITDQDKLQDYKLMKVKIR